jgi:hypothetical protein
MVTFFGADTPRRLAARTVAPIGSWPTTSSPRCPTSTTSWRDELLPAPGGVATIEVPHLMGLLDRNQFDTIHHEHYSHFSLRTLHRILSAHGLTIFDVEQLPTHGGSVRVYAAHADGHRRPADASVADLLGLEHAAGLTTPMPYASFAARVQETERRLNEVLISIKREGRSVAGYGAPDSFQTVALAKGVVTGIQDVTEADIWINGEFFVFRSDIFDYIHDREDLVAEPFVRLIEDKLLLAHRYEGFWAPMDTLKDKHNLEALLESGRAPWEVWESARGTRRKAPF